MSEIGLTVDPVAAILLALFVLGLAVILSIDFLTITVRPGRPRR